MRTDDLLRCLSAEGTFATAYLETPSADPQAASTTTLRWKNLRRELAQAAVDEETLTAMDSAVGVDPEVVERGIRAARDNAPRSDEPDDQAEHAGGDVLAVVAVDGRVVLRSFLHHVSAAGRWAVQPLPWLGPLVQSRQELVPHLVVLLDRRGADVWGADDRGEDVVDTDIEGDDFQIRRTSQGGWSQRRIHQRAVNAWTSNAKEVAAEVAELARSIDARLVVVTGDVHATTHFRDAMPEELAPLVRELESGARGPERGFEVVADDVRRLVRTAVAEETASLVQAFREARGRGARAAEGIADVLGALQMGLVDTLLVHDEPDDERTAWFGPEPTMVARREGDLRALGVEQPIEGRLVDVCLRAAFGTGSAVRMVPGHLLDDDVGAITRGDLPGAAGRRS